MHVSEPELPLKLPRLTRYTPGAFVADTTILINKIAPLPAWALAQRKLIALNAEGVKLWAGTSLDANGYLRGAAHFGIEDGPDDAVESIRGSTRAREAA